HERNTASPRTADIHSPESIDCMAKRCRILVIEDDPDLLTILRIAAEARGHQVFEAADGKEGLDLASELRPDVILLDLMLPVMDGYKVLSALRAEESTEDVPVVVLTARASEGERHLGLTLGANEYITKPYTLNDLWGRVDSLIGQEAVEHVVN